VAVPLAPSDVPVTVCVPEAVAVHAAPVHEPSGAIVNVVLAVMSPSELSYWSRPTAEYVCDVPGAMTAEAGDRTRWSSVAAVTVSCALLVLPPLVPLTVCVPAFVAVQTLPLHDPSGLIVNVVEAVTSPSEVFDASNASAVYVCDAPAAIVAADGLTTM
jgi:hypothetical protein